jgi:hypothetical protein
MSLISKTLNQKISLMESDNKNRTLTELSCYDIISLILEWGTLTHELRTNSELIEQEAFVTYATRLSNLLSSFITQIGICDDFIPLPESVLMINHKQRFDITASDATTSLVYCAHKALECLALIASGNKV